MKKTLLTLATLCLTSAQVLFAQDRTVKGTVLDSQGKPLELAVIKVAGYDDYTAFTDENGNYEIEVPSNATALQIEYGGYATQSVKISETMEPVRMSVAETMTSVTIDGVYTKGNTKLNYVGEAGRISAAQVAKRPITNATQALEGNVSGVVVSTPSGQPGSGATVRIRGFSSVSGNSSPLYVVDGAVYAGDISSINPSDIESYTVLKDATATSLYGSRGSNGVVVITTKNGKGQMKPRINVDAKIGMTSRAIPNYDILKDPGQYFEFAWDAFRNQSGTAPSSSQLIQDLGGYNPYNVPDADVISPDGKINPNAKLRYSDDWDKEIQRNGLRQDYNVSAMGASETSDYYMSLGYLNEKGYIKNSDYERISARINVNTKLKDWVKVGLNLSGAYSTTNSLESTNSTAGGYNPFFVSRNFAPIYPVYYYDAEGNREFDPNTGDYKYDWGAKNASSPLVQQSSLGTRQSLPNANVLGTMNSNINKDYGFQLMAVPYLEAKITKDLTFRSTINYGFFSSYGTNYRNRFYGDSYLYGGSVSKSGGFSHTYTWNQLLTYEKTFNKVHNFTLLAGHENYTLWSNGLSASRRGLPASGIYDLSGSAVAVSSTSGTDEDRLESYLGQINYNYDSRFFFNANIRRDGSSRFAPENRWGNFWSVGAGWIVSNEAFIKNNANLYWIDVLKAKASYGTQGNNGTNYYGYHGLANIGYPNGTYAGAIISQIANPDLTWESQNLFNAGIEFEFDKRLRGEIGYYSKVNADQLYNRPFPNSSGITSRLENSMTSTNSGFEFNINYDIIKRNSDKGFLWNVNLMGATQNNKITKMPDGQDTIINGNFIFVKGHSMYTYYLVESAGVDNTNGDELYKYYDANGEEATTNSASTANVNGRKIGAEAYDKFYGSFTNTLSYRGFEFSFMLTYGLGGKIYDGAYQDLMGNGLGLGNNVHQDWLTNRWTEDNQTGTLPKAEFSNTNIANNSTRWLTSRNYLNFRTVSLAYTFNNSSFIKNAGLSSLRLFLSCDNVWLFTARKGLDPQSTISGNMTGGAQYNYPASRAIIFGVNLGL